MSLLGSSWTKPDRPELEYITTSRQINPAPPFLGRRRGRRKAPLHIEISPPNTTKLLLPALDLAGNSSAGPALLDHLILLPPLTGRANSAPSGAGPVETAERYACVFFIFFFPIFYFKGVHTREAALGRVQAAVSTSSFFLFLAFLTCQQ